MQEIIITEQVDGTLLFETVGFSGSSCELEAKLLADTLGATQSVDYKPEYHRRGFVNQDTKSSKSLQQRA